MSSQTFFKDLFWMNVEDLKGTKIIRDTKYLSTGHYKLVVHKVVVENNYDRETEKKA